MIMKANLHEKYLLAIYVSKLRTRSLNLLFDIKIKRSSLYHLYMLWRSLSKHSFAMRYVNESWKYWVYLVFEKWSFLFSFSTTALAPWEKIFLF